ncbi:DUF4127 family protein [Paenibacillus tyrfis]|uniref:DUF4127 family protein n=1 Tax=Paenibacillus tyrfis TaxID=1501230 RepID=UPI002166704F|nr:DUF4127 family protein [Paenibacillus tyrfis]
MRTILYVPLDERPCNFDFPADLAAGTDFRLVRPELEAMGRKKSPADVERLWAWLFERAAEADGAIVSLDTLVYGGIVPSRLHLLSPEQCRERLDRLRQLKQINPKLRLYAFNLIMRCPSYSSGDEEPDYYEAWGKDIFRRGVFRHRAELGLADEKELAELKRLDTAIPDVVWQDYTERRDVNLQVNRWAVELVKERIVDFMIVPQDDSAPFGLTAVDQQRVREHIRSLSLQLQVYMYPGADEVGCTLLARMINGFMGVRPLIYPHFSSVQGPFVTPLYEDRMLYETLKCHIVAAGAMMASSVGEADLILCVNTPGEQMIEAWEQALPNPNRGYTVLRNLVELTEMAHEVVHRWKKPCLVADVAYANGSDLELLGLLRQKGLLFRLAAYAGWNTNGNTLGTCLAQGLIYYLYGDTPGHRDFLALRLVEDAGYCASVRQQVTQSCLPSMGHTYFSVDGERGAVADLVKRELQQFAREQIDDEGHRVVIDDCRMPWSRMFEVGLRVRVERR